MARRRTDGWEEVTLVVTGEVASALANLGRHRIEDMDPDDKRRMRKLCAAKGWEFADVMTGLGVAELLRKEAAR